MKDWVIGEPLWPRLKRLKKSNPEDFFVATQVPVLI
jgi:hypothetical protein